ncbi:MAG TPA: shikimate kinase [Pyrinomonadaceae bacterium]
MRKKPAQRVVLTGFMAAGKTTVAARLARRLNCRMIDLDEYITAREGRSISSIINEDGERGFRELETRALLDALRDEAARVIALGGGTWTIEKNRALLKEHDCLSVWLDAPFELCWKRINSQSNPRPLARDQRSARQLYEARLSSYALARLRVIVDESRSVEVLALTIEEALFRQAGLH